MSRVTYEVRPPADAAEHERVDLIIAEALLFGLPMINDWLTKLGREHARVVLVDGEVIGGMATLWTAQWFGGRSVPMAGITAVGIAPAQRGRGAARAMMTQALHEARERGVPISALYPATVNLYRRVGYELAGDKLVYELPMSLLAGGDHELAVTVVTTDEQRAQVRQLYARRARLSSGLLDRSDLQWGWALTGRDAVIHTYLLGPAAAPEGYISLKQASGNDPLAVLDLCAHTPAALRRAIALLSDHRSRVQVLHLSGAPREALLLALPERDGVKLASSFPWMLRIVDVAGALAARGYAPELRGELHLEVADELLAHNRGRWVVRVADGQAQVEPGGRGDLRLDVRGLAALYTGYHDPYELALAGVLAGDERAARTAATLFGGPQPYILEMF